jgi:hypothetical protein
MDERMTSTCTDTAAFAEEMRARDSNGVLAPWLFREPGRAQLQALIQAHGVAAMGRAARFFKPGDEQS